MASIICDAIINVKHIQNKTWKHKASANYEPTINKDGCMNSSSANTAYPAISSDMSRYSLICSTGVMQQYMHE
jgi:hypothetical protein